MRNIKRGPNENMLKRLIEMAKFLELKVFIYNKNFQIFFATKRVFNT